jgi:hypothetical protein
MFAEQARTAFLIAWMIVSAVIVPVLAAPFVLPPKTVLLLAPRCQRKARTGRECVLCGMTTSFILISQGRLKDAVGRNRASIPLYAALVGNEGLAVWVALGRLRRTLHQTEEVSCRS